MLFKSVMVITEYGGQKHGNLGGSNACVMRKLGKIPTYNALCTGCLIDPNPVRTFVREEVLAPEFVESRTHLYDYSDR